MTISIEGSCSKRQRTGKYDLDSDPTNDCARVRPIDMAILCNPIEFIRWFVKDNFNYDLLSNIYYLKPYPLDYRSLDYAIAAGVGNPVIQMLVKSLLYRGSGLNYMYHPKTVYRVIEHAGKNGLEQAKNLLTVHRQTGFGISINPQLNFTIDHQEDKIVYQCIRTPETFHGNNSCQGEAVANVIRVDTAIENLRLNGFRISAEGNKQISSALMFNKTLLELDVDECEISSGNATLWGQALKVNSHMLSLRITESVFFECAGIKSLFQGLQSNCTLTSLHLYNLGRFISIAQDNFRDPEDPTFFRTLTDTIVMNTALRSLTMNAMGKEKLAKAIGDALHYNTTLETLRLSTNRFDEETCSIANGLKENCGIKTLELQTTGIGKDEATSLADALRVNTTLTELDISRNPEISSGASMIAEALMENTTLLSLNLRDCWIEDEGAIAISNLLRFNTTLLSLNLAINGIDEDGMIPLGESLAHNHSLTFLDVSNQRFDDHGRRREYFPFTANERYAFIESLANNFTLTTLIITEPHPEINSLIKRNQESWDRKNSTLYWTLINYLNAELFP